MKILLDCVSVVEGKIGSFLTNIFIGGITFMIFALIMLILTVFPIIQGFLILTFIVYILGFTIKKFAQCFEGE